MVKATIESAQLLPMLRDADSCCLPVPAPLVPADITKVLKALADETRLQLLAQIAASSDPVCVCDLTAAAAVNQPTVSHHLKVLRDAGILNVERRGTWGYYSLRPDRNPLVDNVIHQIPLDNPAAATC